MNVQMRTHVRRTFLIHLLVHIHQKEKIALEIAAKFVSVNEFSFIIRSRLLLDLPKSLARDRA